MKPAVVRILAAHYPSALFEGRLPRTRAWSRAQRIEFFFGALLDQTVVADRAWSGARTLRQRLGHLDPARIGHMSSGELERSIRGPAGESLHRFPRRMADYIVGASQMLVDDYAGDPALLWAPGLTVGEVRARLMEFPGIGHKIANMAVRILLEHGRTKLRRLHELDIAVDRHVARVLYRLGLLPISARKFTPSRLREEAESLVVEMLPECPGALDYPLFEVGRTWCHAGAADCDGTDESGRCPLRRICARNRRDADLRV